jgi:hypothetical protein
MQREGRLCQRRSEAFDRAGSPDFPCSSHRFAGRDSSAGLHFAIMRKIDAGAFLLAQERRTPQ